MSVFTELEIEYMAGQRLGRIATVGADGQPHVVPTSFRYNGPHHRVRHRPGRQCQRPLRLRRQGLRATAP
jgi:nitroimidazol reductase NimA-like FMN-containing flavoprotein (pyridoxamine 5'-phosphate oxidase superfamily)